ncbi:MAG: RNA-binding S4 domain-containing protein [Candidatus Margulisiibacteriota bacterium]|jgi:ribosome-associated protein
MENFKLNSEYIELCSLLKVAGPMISGGMAKLMIAEGLVKVDGKVELRKKCKIRTGQIVDTKGHLIKIF